MPRSVPIHSDTTRFNFWLILFPLITTAISNYEQVIWSPLIQSKSRAGMINGQWGIWEAGRLPVCFTTVTVEHCVNINKTVAIRDGEQQLWQRDTDWDVDRPSLAFCPSCCGPRPSLHRYPRSFPIHVNTHRYALFPLSVYSHMLIPINLLLVWVQRRREGVLEVGLSWSEKPAKVGKAFRSHNPRDSADRLRQAWTSFYTEQMWFPTCFT